METIDGLKPMRPVRVEDVPVEKTVTLTKFLRDAVVGATILIVYHFLADDLGLLPSIGLALAASLVTGLAFAFARRRLDRWRAARNAADVTVPASAANPPSTDRPSD